MIIFTEAYQTIIINNNLKEYAEENASAISYHGQQPMIYHENELIWLDINFEINSLVPTYIVKVWDEFDNVVYCAEFSKFKKALNDFMKCLYNFLNKSEAIENSEENFKWRNDELRSIIDLTKVSYYWETHDTSPVLEVFLDGNGKRISNVSEALEASLRVLGITQKDAEVSVEMISDVYGRIMIVFDQNINNKKVIKLVELLKNFGESIMRKEHEII